MADSKSTNIMGRIFDSSKEDKSIDKKVEEKSESTSHSLISSECIKLLNYRIEQEEYSSRIYHYMFMWLNYNGYVGAYKAWQKDADDEMQHSSWAKKFLLDLGVQPKIPALSEPPQKFSGLDDIINQSYDHEVLVTEQCSELACHALEYKNHLLYQLAMKYMQEQQEELGKFQTYKDKLKAFGDDKIAMRLFDNELGG